MPRPTLQPRPPLTPIAQALLAIFLGGSAAYGLLPTQAHAAEASATVNFDIPAGTLDQALSRFGRQTGIQIAVNAELTSGRQSPGLKGKHSIGEGMRQLLAGSGLEAVRDGSGEYTLRKAMTSTSGEAVLSTITVSGKAPGSTTEGSGAYSTRSSSSSTRLNLSPQETPQSLTVMTRQHIDDVHATTLTDVMNATPGITVAKDGVGDEIYGYYARGFDILNFEIDGVPTDVNLNLFNQNMVIYDRVEIVRGATGLISGLGNPAATINLIRKRPTVKPQASVSTEIGSWKRRGASLDISGPVTEHGNVRGRLIADVKEQQSWLDRHEERSGTFYGVAEVDLGDATLLTTGFSLQRTDIDSPLRSGLPARFSDGGRTDLSRALNGSPEWSYNNQKTSSIFTSVEHEWTNGWSGKIEYSHTRLDYDSVYTYILGSLERDGSGLSLLPTRFKGKPEQNNLDLYLTGPFTWFGRTHELIGGLTISRFDVSGPSYGGWQYTYAGSAEGTIANLFNYTGSNSAPSFAVSGGSATESRNNAAYLSSRFNLSDNFKLILGGRFVKWEQDVSDWSTSGSSSKVASKEEVIVPYIGTVYDLNKQWSVYASSTKIFNPQGYWVRDQNDKPLDPLEGKGYEIGLKGSHFGGRLNSSLALFHTSQDNVAIWQSGNFYAAEQNTTAKGFEFEASGELAPDWQVALGFTHVNVTDREGERLNTVLPRTSAKFHTSYRLSGSLSALTVGGGIKLQSQTGSGDVWQGSFALVNLMARYAIDKNLSISVNVDNLFDRKYFSWPGTYSNYGAPRSIAASLKYTF